MGEKYLMRTGGQLRNSQHAKYLIALLLIILLGFSLRLVNTEAFSFWTDEGLTPLRSGYTVSEILSNRIIIQDGVTKDTHPPLFYLLIHFSRQFFGETDFAFRYPSLLLGVLTIPLAYQLGRRLYRQRLGLLFGLLMAINPLQIWYANEARQYMLLVLLTMGATYLLWRAMEEEIGDLKLEIKAQSQISNL
ncbi:MAG TPA: phospholipid carrier-dependent glycosyltransferase, partial [Anaerolineae bacterium]|nr:phospholipid carrier-dependent glycosyltransferase [Anaerolineae bacterium]